MVFARSLSIFQIITTIAFLTSTLTNGKQSVRTRFGCCCCRTNIRLSKTLIAAKPSTDDIQRFQQSINRFSYNLIFSTTNEKETKNFVYSPSSITIALGMLLAGAYGETKSELKNVFLANNINDSMVNTLFVHWLSNLKANDIDAKNSLRFVNKLFVDKSINVTHRFRNDMLNYFGSQMGIIDKTNTSASAKEINQFVNENTKQKIKEIVNAEMLKDSLVVLTNVVYFISEWSSPFHAKIDGNFTNYDNTQSVVKYMKNWEVGRYLYAENDDLQVLGIPFKHEKVDMYFIMHKTVNSSNDENEIEALITNATSIYVNVSIPEFTIEYEYPLTEAMIQLGATRMFDRSAQFNISEIPLKVDQMLHKAYLKVDKNGVEAAAATVVTMLTISAGPFPEKHFIADRPFGFVIRDRKSNINLFLGGVVAL